MKNCIVLKTGENGIVKMFNSHTKTNRDQIAVHKGMDLKGPVSLNGDIIELGYNETVECSSKITAEGVFEKIVNCFNS